VISFKNIMLMKENLSMWMKKFSQEIIILLGFRESYFVLFQQLDASASLKVLLGRMREETFSSSGR